MKQRRTAVAMGHDAFLDIVANLVGILIILVVVLGAQSQAVMRDVQRKADEVDQVDPLRLEAGERELKALKVATARAADAQADSIRLEREIKKLDQQIARQSEQRTQLLQLLGQVEEAWEREKAKLDDQRQAAVERETKASQLQSQLSVLASEQTRLQNRKAPVVAVEHLPTPMAKTVFGEEVHFRLKANRLSVVPMDQLHDELERDVQRMLAGSRTGAVQSAVGPIRGYAARYWINRNNQLTASNGTIARARFGELAAVSIDPIEPGVGVPIATVLSDSNWLDIELAGLNPQSTTVTVWVYPDSYAAFRQLKEKLYARNFLTAARAMGHNQPIMSSPHGSRSAAQ